MRPYRDEAVVLRSLRYGEADRILHLQTREHGRVSAITKGVRRTRSRLGGRLEPLSHVTVHLRPGSGEVQTVTNADLIASYDEVRADADRLRIALTGAEAVLRLFPEAEANERLFDGFVRFLDVVAHDQQPHEALAVAFVLKLVALAGWAPQVTACASCGSTGPLTGYSISAGGAVCESCGGAALDAASLAALRELLARPLGEAATPGEAAVARVRRIASETVAEHVGSRLRTLAP
jgi:DNA repair protein RecO (recombination protein O)